jgi:hypothetical protein
MCPTKGIDVSGQDESGAGASEDSKPTVTIEVGKYPLPPGLSAGMSTEAVRIIEDWMEDEDSVYTELAHRLFRLYTNQRR